MQTLFPDESSSGKRLFSFGASTVTVFILSFKFLHFRLCNQFNAIISDNGADELSGGFPAGVITAGQLLCGGLFSNDRLSNWFSAVALAHGIIDQEEIKVPILYVCNYIHGHHCISVQVF